MLRPRPFQRRFRSLQAASASSVISHDVARRAAFNRFLLPSSKRDNQSLERPPKGGLSVCADRASSARLTPRPVRSHWLQYEPLSCLGEWMVIKLVGALWLALLVGGSPAHCASFDQWSLFFNSSDNHFDNGPTVTTAAGHNSLGVAFLTLYLAPQFLFRGLATPDVPAFVVTSITLCQCSLKPIVRA